MSRARRGTGEQLCLMSTWEGGLKVVQWLQVMNVRYERRADVVTALIVSGSGIVSYASEHVQNELCCCPFMI